MPSSQTSRRTSPMQGLGGDSGTVTADVASPRPRHTAGAEAASQRLRRLNLSVQQISARRHLRGVKSRLEARVQLKGSSNQRSGSPRRLWSIRLVSQVLPVASLRTVAGLPRLQELRQLSGGYVRQQVEQQEPAHARPRAESSKITGPLTAVCPMNLQLTMRAPFGRRPS